MCSSKTLFTSCTYYNLACTQRKKKSATTNSKSKTLAGALPNPLRYHYLELRAKLWMPLVSIRMLANDELSCIELINMCNSGLRAMLCTPHAQIRLPNDKLKLLSTSRYLQFGTLDATCPDVHA